MRNPPPETRCLKLHEWPEVDRSLWLRATTNRVRSFRGDNRAAKLAERSLHKTEAGYGRWLGALAYLGDLHDEPPIARVSVDRLERFFALLQQNANRGYTILGRFEELKRALELMYPPRPFGWILEFGGYHIRDRVRLEQRPIPVIDSGLWLDWAIELLAVAETLPSDRACADLWQDALIIGLLGMRGMRLRTLAGIRIGIHLLEHDTGFRLDFKPADIKTCSALAYPIPAPLNEPMRRFLASERPRLLAEPRHDHLWVGLDGGPLKPTRIQTMLRTRSRHQFGIEFGPHLAKHSFVTSAIQRDPSAPGTASAIVGTSARTLEKHYNHGRAVEAFDTHADTIRRERRAAESTDRCSQPP